MAAQESSSHHASSSLDPEAGKKETLYPEQEEQQAPAFPSLTPLSHDLPLLSPAHTPSFSVDDFLLSRTKASDLNFILSDLRNYSEKLKDELYSIINEDYKDFVSLGSSLKSEAHRIARLGWSSRSEGDHAPQPGLMVPVRDTLLASRSMLKSVQDDIEDCIQRREDATSQRAKLELMLQLHDSVVRLEDLLLIQHERASKDRRRSSHATRRPSVLSIGSVGGRRDSLASVASGSDHDLSDYAVSSEYDEDSDSEEDELSGADDHPKRSRRKILRRLSSGAHHVRSPLHTKESANTNIPLSPTRTRMRSDTVGGAASSSSSLLGLPQRIARTSAEYSRLRFLHRRVDEEGLSHYAEALQDRIDNVRSVLRQDLRTLLGALLSPHSLLVHGQSSIKVPSSPELRKSSRPAAGSTRRASFLQSLSTKPQTATIHEGATNELDAWSQIADPVEEGGTAETAYWEARLEEQRSWLEMALTTLNTLRLVRSAGEGSEGNVKRRNEAEEAVRDLLVSDWAAKVIVDKAQPTDPSTLETSQELPEALRSQFSEHREHVQSLLLPSPSTPSNQLIGLYNAILTFTSTTAHHVIDASREMSLALPTSPDTTADKDRCDIFTNVVWDELSSRLLDSMGNTIFFVGQTDTFYSNFTLTNAFLQRFLALAPTPESKRAMQEHPNWMAFKRRWQLPVYFQMRFREVVTQLEAALAEGRARSGECMRATSATLQAVEKLWSDGVHIHELSAREWRVTLQLLSRFKTWVEEQSPAELASVAGNRPLDVLRTADGSTRSSLDRSSPAEISRVGTPQPPPDLSSQQHEDEQLRLATELLADCFYLRTKMGAVLDEVILARISSQLGGDAGAGLAELRADLGRVLDEESLDFIPGLSASVGRFVHSVLSPRSAAPLRLLRSFSTPAYRQSSSSAAAGGNHAGTGGAAAVQVVHQIFAPLEAFLSLEATRSLPVDVCRGWAEKVLADAFRRYASTIETISKNQQSLIRLKKSQNPSGGSGGGLLGLFKSGSSSNTTAASSAAGQEAETATENTNKQALLTFETKIHQLELDIQLDKWDAWLELKTFLESELDQL